MPKTVDVPGVGLTEFPDGMSDDQISQAIRAQTNWKAPATTTSPATSLTGGSHASDSWDSPSPQPHTDTNMFEGAAPSLLKPVGAFADGVVNEGLRQAGNVMSWMPGSIGRAGKAFKDSLDTPTGSQAAGSNTLKALEYAAPVGKAEEIGANAVPFLSRFAPKAVAKFAPDVAAGAASGAVSAVQGDGAGGIATNAALPLVARPVVNAVGKTLAATLGVKSGVGRQVVERAFQNPDSSQLLKAMRGELNDADVAANLQRYVTDYRDQASADYLSKLNNIKAGSIAPADAGKFVSDTEAKLQQEANNFGAVKLSNGKWDFRHSTLSAGDQSALTGLLDDVGDWGNQSRDLTPGGLDTLKKKVGALTGDSGQLNALANRVYDDAGSRLGKLIPGYEDMTSEYAKSSDFLRKIQSELGVKASGNTNPGTTVRKLSYLLKQNNDYREMLINKMGPKGQELLDQIAGRSLSSNIPRGLAQYALETPALYLAHSNPVTAAASIAASSPRLVGEGTRLAGKIAASPITPKLARPLTQTAISDLSSDN